MAMIASYEEGLHTVEIHDCWECQPSAHCVLNYIVALKGSWVGGSINGWMDGFMDGW